MNNTVPFISIKPFYLTLYSRSESVRPRSSFQRENEANLSQNDHNGKISRKANKRIRSAIDWLLYLSKEKSFYHKGFKRNYRFKVNFITLTLSAEQLHSDQVIKRDVLQPFLDHARKVWKVGNYVWRAEAQRNGNVHFHIVTDKFIPWVEIRNVWNKYQAKLGYLKRFQAKHGHRVPNSTDVHSIWKVRNLGQYLAKYCAKEAKGRAIKGKQWGLSYSLSRLKSCVELRCNEIEAEVRKIWSQAKDKIREFDYHTVIYITSNELKKIGCTLLPQLMRSYVRAALSPI